MILRAQVAPTFAASPRERGSFSAPGGRGARGARSTVAAFAAAASLSGCIDEQELPQPPDLDPLAARYEAPSGSFRDGCVAVAGGDVSEECAAAIDLLERLVERSRLVETLSDELAYTRLALADLSDRAASGDGNAFAAGRQLSVALNISYDCPGWDEATPGQGQVQLSAGADERGLVPVIFGAATDCTLRLPGAVAEDASALPVSEGRSRLHGSLAFRLDNTDGRVPFGALAKARILYEFDGEVEVFADGAQSFEDERGFRFDFTQSPLSFAFDPEDSSIEVLEGEGNYEVVFRWDPTTSGLTFEVGARGSDGFLSCDIVTSPLDGTCEIFTTEDGQSLAEFQLEQASP